MKKIILLFLISINSVIVLAQLENIPMSFGLGVGIDIINNEDINASPLSYNGFGLPIGINGFKMSEKWINHFEVQLILPVFTNNYTLKTKAKTQLIDWAKVNLRYRLLRSINNDSNNFLGGEIKSSFFYREYDFLDGFGWEFQNSINFNYARKLNLTTNSFILPQMSMPLLGYINRKPSLTYDEAFLDDFRNKAAINLLKYGQWKTLFNDWIAIEFDVLYHLNISEKFNFQSSIGFNYYSIRFPEKVQNINIPIRCYLNYQL